MTKKEKEEKEEIGEVTHYFTKIHVGAVKIYKKIEVGDRIKIEGATTDFEQKIDSIQINQQDVEKAEPGDEVGIKFRERVREGDKIYKK